jgi:hypothetical protein
MAGVRARPLFSAREGCAAVASNPSSQKICIVGVEGGYRKFSEDINLITTTLRPYDPPRVVNSWAKCLTLSAPSTTRVSIDPSATYRKYQGCHGYIYVCRAHDREHVLLAKVSEYSTKYSEEGAADYVTWRVPRQRRANSKICRSGLTHSREHDEL